MKERLLDGRQESREETGSLTHKRVPSAGARDFKINHSNASPNTSEMRAKKINPSISIPTSVSMQNHLKRNNFVEPEPLNLSALVSKKQPSSLIIHAPLSSFQRKIKDMLGSGQSFLVNRPEKSGPGHKRVKSNAKLESSNKSRKIMHRKSPSVKVEVSPKQNLLGDLSMGLPPRPDLSELQTKIKPSIDHQSLVEGTSSSLKKTLGKKHLELVESSKESFKKSSLYQKFAKKLQTHTTQFLTDLNNNKAEITKKQKSNAVLKMSADTPKDAESINLSKVLGDIKTHQSHHKRTGSENLKKVKVDKPEIESSLVQKHHRATSGNKKSNQGQPSDSHHFPQDDTKSVQKETDKSDLKEVKQVNMVSQSLEFTSVGTQRNPLQNYPKKKSLHLENIKRHEALLPPFEGAKVILKDFGRIKSFSVNTHQGVFRNYNEDRVSILLNAQQR